MTAIAGGTITGLGTVGGIVGTAGDSNVGALNGLPGTTLGVWKGL